MYDAQFWAKAWQEARRTSSLGSGYHNEQAWRDFWDLFAEHYALRNRQSRPAADAVVEYLVNEGVVNPESRVLDIGCGPGTYTLALAARAKQVTGLDLSESMLEMLQKEARHCGVEDRLEIAPVDWREFPSEPTYDLVFAAKTPAIHDYSSLMKMNQVARRFCCLVTFAGPYNFALRNQLWEHIMGQAIQSRAFDVQYPFNILYQAGYLPHLKFFSHRHQYQEPLAYLLKHYTCYFKIFGQEGKEVETKIQDFLMDRAQDGYCDDFIEETIAVMWWKTI
ncbi:MAG: class I SAM-dependent methyltransferase [Syntrophomonadaceae bacterium]|nr:class I SAM-dependent methyltransferase [Syntrophomonadaceae bacterium]